MTFHGSRKPYLLDNYDDDDYYKTPSKPINSYNKPYLSQDEKFDKFVKSVLWLDENPKSSIAEAIIGINTMNEEAWEFFATAVSLNIEVFYNNVYGEIQYPSFDIIFNKLIGFLEKQVKTDRMEALIEILADEWEAN